MKAPEVHIDTRLHERLALVQVQAHDVAARLQAAGLTEAEVGSKHIVMSAESRPHKNIPGRWRFGTCEGDVATLFLGSFLDAYPIDKPTPWVKAQASMSLSRQTSRALAHELQHTTDFTLLGNEALNREEDAYNWSTWRRCMRGAVYGAAAIMTASGVTKGVSREGLVRRVSTSGLFIGAAGLAYTAYKAGKYVSDDYAVYRNKPGEQRAFAAEEAYMSALVQDDQSLLVHISYNLAV